MNQVCPALNLIHGNDRVQGSYYVMRPFIGRSLYFWSGFLSFVYAVTDEYHQYYVAGRYPAAMDVLIDTIGIITALSLIRRLQD